jgi:hypothetical protein
MSRGQKITGRRIKVVAYLRTSSAANMQHRLLLLAHAPLRVLDSVWIAELLAASSALTKVDRAHGDARVGGCDELEEVIGRSPISSAKRRASRACIVVITGARRP